MPHPFFECSTYPWERGEARALHRALYDAVDERDDIALLYKASGPALPPLPAGSAKAIWKAALEALATAERLRQFCDVILEDKSLASIHDRVHAVIDAQDTRTAPARAAQPPGGTAAQAPVAPLPKKVQQEAYESLVRLRTELPERIDRTFLPERLVRRVQILPPHAFLVTEETLRNVSNVNCSDIVHVITSDAPADFNQLKVTAKVEFPDVPDRRPFRAPIDYEESRDGKLFRVTLGFGRHVVPPLGRVTIRWECLIPGSVARARDYWVFPFLFERPAEAMTLEAAFRQDPLEVHLYLDGSNSQNEQPRLEPLDVPDVVKEARAPRAPWFVYRMNLAGTGGTYLFTWHRKSRPRS